MSVAKKIDKFMLSANGVSDIFMNSEEDQVMRFVV